MLQLPGIEMLVVRLVNVVHEQGRLGERLRRQTVVALVILHSRIV